ncbi:DUF3035 domain-containing protein [Defluviimonas sp. SAOS-178_SWC]|uniref:DUF3035 domain-containing protein n=1 Tax=Defluviimonas sp. SAOS-178_SWC TaxID=3121287 RepID=UPI0032217B90
MGAKTGIRALAICALVAVTACGRLAGDEEKAPKLLNIKPQGRGPDEFTVLPTKPLQLPDDLAALPEPTPGGTNITDPTPEADAVAALGGNPAALDRKAVPAGNGALVSYAARRGTSADIREVLAAEDLEYRRKHDGRLLERWFNVNVYYRAYQPMSLDQYAELERWRAAGVRNVGAPPLEAVQGN